MPIKRPPRIKKLPENRQISFESASYDPRPVINVSEDVIGEVRQWNIGDKKRLVIDTEVIGVHIVDFGKDSGKAEAKLRVTGMGMMD